MNNFKCVLLEQGIHVKGEIQDLNGKDYPVSLLVSYEEEDMSWVDGNEWAAKQRENATTGTRSQWLAIQTHRHEINEQLRAAGKKELAGWYWTREEYANDTRFAWCVSMFDGDVYYDDKGSTSYVRAVSAFQI